MKRDDWNRRYAAADLVWSAGPNRFLAPEVEGLAPGRALDLACGEGRNALWLAQQGWEVTAIDFSDVAIDKARGRADQLGVQVDFRVGDVTDPLPATGLFDLIIVFYLQLPWPQMRTVLTQARSALAPGGVFLLVGHDSRNLAEGTGGPSSPDVLYSPAAVAAELAPLEIVRVETVERPVEGAERPALDALVRAVKTT